MNFSVLCKTLKGAKMRSAESSGIFQFIFESVFLRRKEKVSFSLKLLCAKCYPSHEIFILPAGAGMKSHILELRRRELYSK